MTDYAAAWYPHPTRPGMLRWYDGNEWTDAITYEGSVVVGSEALMVQNVDSQGPTVHAGELGEPAQSAVPMPPAPSRSFVDHTPVALGGQPLVGTDEQRGQIVCQFCGERGCVTARRVARVKRKTATRIAGAVVTMGGSALLTGVSKKGAVTELSCSNCGMSWDV